MECTKFYYPMLMEREPRNKWESEYAFVYVTFLLDLAYKFAKYPYAQLKCIAQEVNRNFGWIDKKLFLQLQQ